MCCLLDDEVRLHILRFILPVERFQSLTRVCKAWQRMIVNDPMLWSSVVLTPSVPQTNKLSNEDRVLFSLWREYPPGDPREDLDPPRDPTRDEYDPSRLALLGTLPLAPKQMSQLPNSSWIQTLFIHADWLLAGGEFSGQAETDSAVLEDLEDEDEDEDEDGVSGSPEFPNGFQ